MNNLIVILYIAGFVRTLLIILIVYYLIKFIGKYLLPLLISNQKDKYEYKNNSSRSGKKEGEVTVDTSGKRKTDRNGEEGEYVDFEEVE